MIRLTKKEIDRIIFTTSTNDKYDDVAQAQLKKAIGAIQSKFKREVIPSGSKRYSADVVEFLNSMNSAYFMVAREDWQVLLKECE